MHNNKIRIVEMTGGLGNQMFQYAFGKYLEKIYPKDIIKFDCSYYGLDNSIRTFSLENVFGLKVNKASKREVRAVRGFFQYDSKLDRTIFKIVGLLKNRHKKKHNVQGDYFCEIIEDLDKDFEENNILTESNSYYSGYWQSEKYFISFRKKIYEDFSFNLKEEPEEFSNILKKIQDSNSIALHVRLEDYLNEENCRVYGEICTADYYFKAIEYFNKEYEECIFYVFSTDLEAAMDFLPKGYKYVPVVYDGQKDYLDMYLMTKCRHSIIANSTFSWWGAWLNTYPDKKVICPDRWFNNHDVYNQYCEGWIKV